MDVWLEDASVVEGLPANCTGRRFAHSVLKAAKFGDHLWGKESGELTEKSMV